MFIHNFVLITTETCGSVTQYVFEYIRSVKSPKRRLEETLLLNVDNFLLSTNCLFN